LGDSQFVTYYKIAKMLSAKSLFLQHLAQTSPFPLGLEIVRAEGVYLYDASGKAYMDLISGINVSSLGHGHPAVVQAVCEQAQRFMHVMVYGEYALSPQTKLADLLLGNLPQSLDNVYFVNSGAEAVEGAMKLAKRHTGRSELLACRRAYHGSTQGAMSLMSEPDHTRAFRPLLPGVGFITHNEQASLAAITERTAAVVAEVVQGEAGVRPAEKGFLQALRHRCDQTGALLIFDEIQTGFGRTGKLFAFEHYGIVPDVLLLAKGMGGGLPLGAFIAPRHIMQSLSHSPLLGHITTFGGNPLCCAASLATLQTLLEEGLMERVAEKEARFREKLQHPSIREVRSMGLMLAVELADFGKVERTIAHCLANGLIIDWFLFNDRSLRLAPPLTISFSEIDRACEVILQALRNS
jgi:acetylornithine/N-succinyldiaminopimelate aminotransferase